MWHVLFNYCANIVCTLLCLFLVRIFIVYQRIHKPMKIMPRANSNPAKLMVVLGSGGHTFEMLHLLKHIGPKFRPRIYIIADSDILSEKKVLSLETMPVTDAYTIEKIPRSREVGQSWISSVMTTFVSFLKCLQLVFKHKPDAILNNGPGTCVPVCVAAFLSHVLGVKHIKIIYVESICRVKTMSLSGKILYPIADYFLVQWPQLKEKYPRSRYLGKLM
ncbi:UDP-N-acetylglucosamine transferase subunit ALG14 homolog isoform X2 [Uloborus diversus]|uniref:UDP-N-acetylglucosamine transferase subunit ALG14 homolog isoform X2 n=1 Tax=Uloborus diversus TaxID=327109 RepID=UPI00240923F9|nr:UDP-N-acetylglucosamine transferase subunit ALG14 homolog isoform X2 [Uloborus diversus]